MLADSDAVRDDTPPRNAAEAVQRLTQETQSLVTKLRQLIGSLQRSSSDNVSSTLQHLAVYDEAVQSLQANATAAIFASDAMQQACGKLYEELAAVDSLAKEVHDLRNKVEHLEAQVLNSISKPPGSAPPFIPFKPVPRLVPLPSRHTLPVQQPNRFKLSNFGHLREENLQMVLLARRITQQLVDIREEALEEKEVRAAWTVEQSAIWRPRLREADSRGFWDTPGCRDRIFEADWARACNKEKFATMMARENKNSKV